LPAPATKIWLPGVGVTDLGVRAVAQAVKLYDENLDFGRNEDTGQWCVFLLRRGELPLPVLGFEDVPSPEYAVQRLHRADALRRGDEILNEINDHNKRREDGYEQRAREADAMSAEHYRWAFEQQGKTPYFKSIGRKNPNKMGGYS
jgi:hypothetical protein